MVGGEPPGAVMREPRPPGWGWAFWGMGLLTFLLALTVVPLNAGWPPGPLDLAHAALIAGPFLLICALLSWQRVWRPVPSLLLMLLVLAVGFLFMPISFSRTTMWRACRNHLYNLTVLLKGHRERTGSEAEILDGEAFHRLWRSGEVKAAGDFRCPACDRARRNPWKSIPDRIDSQIGGPVDYVINPLLAGWDSRRLAEVDRSKVPWIWDAVCTDHGGRSGKDTWGFGSRADSRCVLFLDGHFEVLVEADFRKLMKERQVP